MKLRPPERYGLAASMAEVREIPDTMESLVEFLNMGDGYMNGEITPDMVRFSFLIHDDRIGWDTYTVYVNDHVVAFADGTLTPNP